MGDFDFDGATELEPAENITYWTVWLLLVVITSIVFLNFIIAEASASYEDVKCRLNEMISDERAGLIQESEFMIPEKFKTNQMFPAFIIVRQMEN